jgi:hypothetical protein
MPIQAAANIVKKSVIKNAENFKNMALRDSPFPFGR